MDPEKSLKSQLKKESEDEDDGPPLKEDPKYIKVRVMGTPFVCRIMFVIAYF